MSDKRNYRIAVDINDVLRDFTRQFKNIYTKFYDRSFVIEYDDITDHNLFNIFPFVNENGEPDINEYYRFLYEDYPYELYARAQVMEQGLISQMSLWLQNDMRNFDDNKNPDLILVSPFEMNLSIQSTLSFLAKMGCRFREIYFPMDSATIWDKCDLLITANPTLIENKPEGKIAIKINAPYNQSVEADYTFDGMSDIITDPDNTLIKLIEEYNNATD